jgi:arabinogalactan oligomer/maltooligosaccharide transport system substrate-binding protein
LTVETLFVAHDDLLQSYAQAVENGGGPDLLLAPNWWLQEMVALEIAQPLDDLVSTEELSVYWPAALDSLRWQETLYGLPAHFNLTGLYVNNTLAPPQGPPVTTSDMLDLARQSTTFGTGLYANLFHLYWGFPAYGAQLTDGDGRAILDQNDGAAAYLTWLINLDETQGSHVDLDYGMLLDRFKKGEFAFFVDGPWALPDLRDALGDSLAVAPLPSGPAGPAGPWVYTESVFVNPVSTPQQQKLALLLASHLTGPGAGSHMAQDAALLPAHRQANLGSDPIIASFVDQVATAEAMPNIAEMNQILGYGGDMIIRALSRSADPTTIVAETTALINDETGK